MNALIQLSQQADVCCAVFEPCPHVTRAWGLVYAACNACGACLCFMPWQLMRVICPGGISYTRGDYTEEGSGGMFKTADDYSRAMSGLTMYPEVIVSISHLPKSHLPKQHSDLTWPGRTSIAPLMFSIL